MDARPASPEPVVVAPQDERSTQGLSRRITRQDRELVELRARLAEFEANKTQPDRNASPDDREMLAREITESVTEAESSYDWKSEASKLREELRKKDAALTFKNDPVASRLLAAGVDPDSLSEDLLNDLRRAAADSDFGDGPAFNPINNRSGSRDEQEKRILQNTPSLFDSAF